ncbi:MAG: hypothetical protein L3K03_00735 [Thermoplasmata archaeon]|nr:hypothetical protein [Thermoplasmata archaeon]
MSWGADRPIAESTASTPVLPGPVAPTGGLLTRLTTFLRLHPVVCLFLLTPGLVEYLSGSSSFVFLVLSPGWFFLALGINAAMYTSGALLIREAMIRWRKGWPTAIALGAAYAIMEEGIADQTIFNPHTSPLGPAGVYGHLLGVNWLWLPQVFLIHILMSIAIPLLLLSYALPETRGKSFLTDRQVAWVVALIAADTAFLTLLVSASVHYWYGYPLLAVAIGSIVGLCVLGRRLPTELPLRRPGPPTGSRGGFFLLGCFVYPGAVLLTIVGAGSHLPPVVVFAAIVGELALAGLWFLRHIGTEANERHLVVFAAGLFALGILLGLLFEFPLEFVVLADVAVIYFLFWLDRDLERRAFPRPSARRDAGPVVPPAPSIGS